MAFIPGGYLRDFEHWRVVNADLLPPESDPVVPPPPRYVPAFCLDQYEASERDYRACVSCPSVAAREPPGNAGLPVGGLSHDAARAFCVSRDKRLPRLDEWLFAAVGESDWTNPWGTSPLPEGLVCRGRLAPCARGTRPRDQSPFGVFDLGGGVPEWTELSENGQVIPAVRGPGCTDSPMAATIGNVSSTLAAAGVRCAALPLPSTM